MTAAVFRPVTIPLHRPWWRRLAQAWQARRERRAAIDRQHELRDALCGLSDRLLRDIGAPEWARGAEPREALRRFEPGRG